MRMFRQSTNQNHKFRLGLSRTSVIFMKENLPFVNRVGQSSTVKTPVHVHKMSLCLSCFFEVDVYSFGVLLCEMCIGELPDAEKREEQVLLMSNRTLRGLVRRCLETDPEARPTMQEIIDELSRAV